MFKYNEISHSLLADLPERTREVLVRRFGLHGHRRETLEMIGEEYGITRERVRQIERDGVRRVMENSKKKISVFISLNNEMERFGGVKREDKLVRSLSKEEQKDSHLIFLLSVGEYFKRMSETEERHSLWTNNENSLYSANEVIEHACKLLMQEGAVLSVEDIDPSNSIPKEKLVSYLEISKKIGETQDGNFGLSSWPEVNPRGVKDKSYLAMKREGRPLHFRQVCSLIGGANPQTVHNELIKDDRFILVGRGVYALSEWGYSVGEVKDVIRDILKKEGPLTKDEIIEKVFSQRMVKKNTIVQNLNNKRRFVRSHDGKYTIA